MTRRIILVLIIMILTTAGPVGGYVSESTNYRIQKDSINISGKSSESTSFRLEDTIGEIGTGTSTSASYNLQAGYQAMQTDAFISLSTAANVTLNPLTNVSGGSSMNTRSWTVITDNNAGYALSIKAATSPALKATNDSLADYTPAQAVPDFSFNIAVSESAFGYSPEGDDIVSRFKDNGSICGTGSLDSIASCWDGFSTANVIVAQGINSNVPFGAATTIRFRADVGSSRNQAVGNYTATITITAVAL